MRSPRHATPAWGKPATGAAGHVGQSSSPLFSPFLRQALLAFALILLTMSPSLVADTVTGTVTSLFGPLAGARVRAQTDLDYVETDAQGHFSVEVPAGQVIVTAGKYMCFNGNVTTTGGSSVNIDLKWMNFMDDFTYEYIDPRPESSHSYRCSGCHNASYYLPWSTSVMATSVDNSYVYSYYNGTDAAGNPGHGYGFRIEHPDDYGDCANCHAPGRASKSTDPLSAFKDLNLAEGVSMAGIQCDFCHKISWAEASTLPAPIQQKYRMRRPWSYYPAGGAGPMIGPLDDVSYPWMGSSYSPVMSDSVLCAICHLDDNDLGVPSEETYLEWLNSSYPAQGEGCTECHIESDGSTMFISPSGVARDPSEIHQHTFHGKTEIDLTNALTLSLDAAREGGEVAVTVTLDNDLSGHAVPTGFHTRNMILLVTATDQGGDPLVQISGEVVPEWGGIGDPQDGDYAGLPGKGYAKILTDGTNERVFYTDATAVLSDNRIPADGSDVAQFVFADPGAAAGNVHVAVALLYRRAWKDVMDEKAWAIPDVEMEAASADLPLEQPIDVEIALAGPGQLHRGETLQVWLSLTNAFPSDVVSVTRAEFAVPGYGTVTRGPVDITVPGGGSYVHVVRFPIPGVAPFGVYTMEMISEVGGSESDRDSLTFEVIP